MMRRIYFLVPDIATTKRIVDDLLLARIEERHIHVIAKRGTELEDLPEANLLQKSDFAGGVLLGSALVGAGVGAWAGSLIGVSTPNSRIKQFEEAIESGHLLVLADVPKSRVAEIEARIKQHLPEVDIEGTEPIIPAFP
jgi:hypothetical protein